MLSLIIPTLNAGKTIALLLDEVFKQTVVPDEIIIIDSESDDETLSVLSNYNSVRIIKVKRNEFDHGGTRDYAFRLSNGDIVCLMTQDALPANNLLFENLIAMLKSDDMIAVVSARQIAHPDASEREKLVRKFNYPPESSVKSAKDIDSLGIKAFFCSDVCAAYRRDIFEMLGGFEYPVLTNEDMFFAAKAINSGYKTAYCADSAVFHSHNFTLLQQFSRYLLQGYEMEKRTDLLKNVKQNCEGARLVKYVSSELLKNGQTGEFIVFSLDCFARFIGRNTGRALSRHEKKTGRTGFLIGAAKKNLILRLIKN